MSDKRRWVWFAVGVALSFVFGWVALAVILVLWGTAEVLAR